MSLSLEEFLSGDHHTKTVYVNIGGSCRTVASRKAPGNPNHWHNIENSKNGFGWNTHEKRWAYGEAPASWCRLKAALVNPVFWETLTLGEVHDLLKQKSVLVAPGVTMAWDDEKQKIRFLVPDLEKHIPRGTLWRNPRLEEIPRMTEVFDGLGSLGWSRPSGASRPHPLMEALNKRLLEDFPTKFKEWGAYVEWKEGPQYTPIVVYPYRIEVWRSAGVSYLPVDASYEDILDKLGLVVVDPVKAFNEAEAPPTLPVAPGSCRDRKPENWAAVPGHPGYWVNTRAAKKGSTPTIETPAGATQPPGKDGEWYTGHGASLHGPPFAVLMAAATIDTRLWKYVDETALRIALEKGPVLVGITEKGFELWACPRGGFWSTYSTAPEKGWSLSSASPAQRAVLMHFPAWEPRDTRTITKVGVSSSGATLWCVGEDRYWWGATGDTEAAILRATAFGGGWSLGESDEARALVDAVAHPERDKTRPTPDEDPAITFPRPNTGLTKESPMSDENETETAHTFDPTAIIKGAAAAVADGVEQEMWGTLNREARDLIIHSLFGDEVPDAVKGILFQSGGELLGPIIFQLLLGYLGPADGKGMEAGMKALVDRASTKALTNAGAHGAAAAYGPAKALLDDLKEVYLKGVMGNPMEVLAEARARQAAAREVPPPAIATPTPTAPKAVVP